MLAEGTRNEDRGLHRQVKGSKREEEANVETDRSEASEAEKGVERSRIVDHPRCLKATR